jgi:tRNA G18 (ribose-2'-O)-methylase SpoU
VTRTSSRNARGYCAIGIQGGKSPENAGTLWRSAHALGAAFIFTVGHRYPKQPSDTSKAWRHIPLLEFDDSDEFVERLPHECELVAVECGWGSPKTLPEFRHPERAVYVLGAEDHGVAQVLLNRADRLVEIPATLSLNVATAGSIVLYDRQAKAAA